MQRVALALALVCAAAPAAEPEADARRAEARAALARAEVESGLGEREAALASYERARAGALEAGDLCTAARAASGRGHLLWLHGDFEAALAAQERAAPEAERCGEPRLVRSVSFRRALVAGARGEFADALERYEALRRELDAADGALEGERAFAAFGAGDALLYLRRAAEALAPLAEAVESARSAGNRAHEARALGRLGEARAATGDRAGARRDLQAALALWRRHGEPEGRAYALAALARLDRAEGDLARAGARLAEALDLLEGVRRSVVSTGLRAAFLARRHVLFREHAELLLERHAAEPGAGFDRAAFRAAERARVRALLDRLAPADGNGAEPGDAALLSADEVQGRLLAPGELLLAYLLGERRAYLFAVATDRFRAVPLAASRAELERAARAGAESAARSYERLGAADAEAAMRALGESLLGPVPEIANYPTLLVVADGALARVPFAALADPARGGEPLLAGHELVLVSSASAAAARRARRSRPAEFARDLLLVGDPVYSSGDPRLAPAARERASAAASRRRDGVRPLARLPGTGRELARIASLASGLAVETVSGFAASRDWAVRGGLAGARLLHFATHALADERRADGAGLALSALDAAGAAREGLLRLEDLRGLALDAELVFLSACSTRGGRTLSGEGPQSVTRGFLDAGAARVVATLWPARDRAAAALVESFYRGLLLEARPPAAALRAAQLELRARPEYAAPHFWAGFVLEGDWR